MTISPETAVQAHAALGFTRDALRGLYNARGIGVPADLIAPIAAALRELETSISNDADVSTRAIVLPRTIGAT